MTDSAAPYSPICAPRQIQAKFCNHPKKRTPFVQARTRAAESNQMPFAILLILAATIIPTLVYVLIFYWADRYEREPRWLIAVAFFWGAVPAIVISLVAELILGAPFDVQPDSLFGSVVTDSIIAPIVEEVAKAAALYGIYMWKRQEFDGVLDGIVYGALVGFGFAMTENLFYYIGAFMDGGLGSLTILIFLRSVLFGLNHAFYTSLTGIGLGIARNKRSFIARSLWCLVGLMAAIFAHSLHNFGATLSSINFASFLISLVVAGAGLAITFIAIGLSWQQERNIISAELAPEVGSLLTNEEYGQLTEQWRQPDRTKQLSSKPRRQLLIEYANRSYRLRRQGIEFEPELTDELANLRSQLLQTQALPIA